MSRPRCLPLCLPLVLAILLAPYAVAERLPAIDNANTWRMQGNVSPHARPESDRGTASGTLAITGMKLVFAPTAAQQSDLDTLLRQQLDASSPNYHKWLTPEDYANRFGLGTADMARAAQWLRQQGFTNVLPARSRTWISFSGTAAQVQAAFHTSVHQYLLRGELHYANATEPALPAAFRGVVTSIGGLNDFRPKVRGTAHSVLPHFTSDLSGNHYLAPDDFATIYDVKGLYNSGVDGSGRTIVVVGQSDLSKDSGHNNQYDVVTFRSVSNLPAASLQVVLVPGDSDPGLVSADADEANLDLEWSGAVARNAALVYVNSQNALFDAAQYAVDQDLGDVISISYGDCEANFSSSDISTLTRLAQQANAQGQTMVASTGDSGAADCDYSSDPNNPVKSATHGYAVDVPASLPYVTAMGGSEFSEGDDQGATQYWSGTNNGNQGSALSYIPEMAWNDSATDGDLSAGGGGASKLFSKPSWQTGTGVPGDGQRDLPDLSFNSSADHDGYLICSQSSCVNGYRQSNSYLTVIGGTSAASPTFAGVVTLLVQQTNDRQGNVNPLLYGLAASTPAAFHDITTGNNDVPCTAGSTDCPASGEIGFSAGTGYDQATGLGSIDAGALAAVWNGSTNPDFAITAQSQSLTITRGTPVNDVVTITGLAGYSSSVSLSCTVSSTLSSTTCSISPSSVDPGGTATLTITGNSLSASLPHERAPMGRGWMSQGWIFAFGFVMAGGASRKRRAATRKGTVLGLLMCLMLITVSCGGGGSSSSNQQEQSSQSSQSGTVSVQATSGSIAHTLNLAVTVNQ